jgi:hypothetical protein
MWWLDLGEETPRIVWTSLVVPSRAIPALSADGSRVALLEDGTVSVYDLATEKLVAAIRLPEALRRATILFLENDRLRLVARTGNDDSQQLRIGEVDLGTAEITETGRVDGLNGSNWMALNAEADRMILALRKDRTSVTTRSLRDARDGTLIREIDRRGSMRFLSDGRLISLMEDPDGETRVVVESSDGVAISEQPLGSADWESVGGEALPGQVVVGRLERLDERDEGHRYDLLDIDSGTVRPMAVGLRRAHHGFQWVWGGGGTIYWYIDAPESNRIFTDRTGAIVRWDPSTGDLVHIVGGRRD